MWIRFYLFLFLLALPISLYAKGFEKGKIYFYLDAGIGLGNNKGTIERKVENQNVPLFIPPDLTDNYLLQNLLIRSQAKEDTRLSGESKNYGGEFAIFRYMGIGLSYFEQSIKSNRFPDFNPTLYFLTSSNSTSASEFYTKANAVSLFSYGTQSEKTIFRSGLLDLAFYFHALPSSSWDPYLKMGGGMGTERIFGGATNRLFASVGLRYHFNDLAFVSTELEHANIYIVNYVPPSYGFRNTGNYEETSLKLGFGLGFRVTSPESEEETSEKYPHKKIPEKPKGPSSQNLSETNGFIAVARFSYLASEIFETPSSRMHIVGKKKLEELSNKIQNEFKDLDVLIITTVSPYKEGVEGRFDNYDLGFERAKKIGQIMNEKGVLLNKILPTTKGSSGYDDDPVERVIIELRRRD